MDFTDCVCAPLDKDMLLYIHDSTNFTCGIALRQDIMQNTNTKRYFILLNSDLTVYLQYSLAFRTARDHLLQSLINIVQTKHVINGCGDALLGKQA
jgi:hypothetical protein